MIRDSWGRYALGAFTFCAALAWAADARAADDKEIRKIVQEEIKAAADKKKKDQGDVMTVKWKEGLKFESNDKRFKAYVGGRVLLDTAFYADDDWVDAGGADQQDSVAFRDVRLQVGGDIYTYGEFRAEVGFVDQNKGTATDTEVQIRNVYFGLKNLSDCWGCAFPDIRVGHFKEPFSLEEQTSTRFLTFMERALPNVLSPAFNTGLMVHDVLRGDQLTYGVGV
jgi:phosphate-selective porin OprO/OprP